MSQTAMHDLDILRPSSAGARLLGWADDRLAILFLIPGLTCLSAVILYPVVYNALLGFTNASLMFPGWRFIGTTNFELTLTDPLFWTATVNTLVWTAASVVGQLLLGLVAALALERVTAGRTV